MSRALELARQAALEGEVPVGAVVVLDGRIIGEGRNQREKSRNALSHAELEAIDAACKALNGWRLWQCDYMSHWSLAHVRRCHHQCPPAPGDLRHRGP